MADKLEAALKERENDIDVRNWWNFRSMIREFCRKNRVTISLLFEKSGLPDTARYHARMFSSAPPVENDKICAEIMRKLGNLEDFRAEISEMDWAYDAYRWNSPSFAELGVVSFFVGPEKFELSVTNMERKDEIEQLFRKLVSESVALDIQEAILFFKHNPSMIRFGANGRSGTGFALCKELGITCKHVTEPRVGYFKKGFIVSGYDVAFFAVPILPSKLVAKDSDSQFCFDITDDEEPKVGDEMFKNGAVTGRTFGKIIVKTKEELFIESSVFGPFAFHGDSGAPVWNVATKKFVGIVQGPRQDGVSNKPGPHYGRVVRVLRYDVFICEYQSIRELISQKQK